MGLQWRSLLPAKSRRCATPSAVSRLQLFCLLLLHQHTVRDGLEAQVRWRSAGVVPVLLATAHEL